MQGGLPKGHLAHQDRGDEPGILARDPQRLISSATDAAVAVDVDSFLTLEPLYYEAQQFLSSPHFHFEPIDSLLECRGLIGLRRNLALLVEIPEQSHAGSMQPYVGPPRAAVKNTTTDLSLNRAEETPNDEFVCARNGDYHGEGSRLSPRARRQSARIQRRSQTVPCASPLFSGDCMLPLQGPCRTDEIRQR